MTKTVKHIKVQYKDWTCYQAPCARSGSGCIQRIVSDDPDTRLEFTDSAIVRSTKRQLYRYLRWFVDSKEYQNISLLTKITSFNGIDEVEPVALEVT